MKKLLLIILYSLLCIEEVFNTNVQFYVNNIPGAFEATSITGLSFSTLW